MVQKIAAKLKGEPVILIGVAVLISLGIVDEAALEGAIVAVGALLARWNVTPA